MESQAQIFEGELDATDFRFGIVVSRFNAQITDELLKGALDALHQQGAVAENIFVLADVLSKALWLSSHILPRQSAWFLDLCFPLDGDMRRN